MARLPAVLELVSSNLTGTRDIQRVWIRRYGGTRYTLGIRIVGFTSTKNVVLKYSYLNIQITELAEGRIQTSA